MCGIAGLMTRAGSPPNEIILDALTAALGHRGPDGEGRHVRDGVGLVQTRLAIIDLVTGDQPFYAGDSALVCNGEIYNYRELKNDLPEEAFATSSDCELPLHLYVRYGLDFVDHLRGMYAIAIHDAAAGRLVLSRDPFGIKPLYFAETLAGFAFASEPQALIASGMVEPRISTQARDEVFQLQFGTGDQTAFDGIRRVLPGETLVIEAARIVERRRKPALPEGGPEYISPEDALSRLDEALMTSVDLHQRADVPYGMFLSGGIDSSALLACMARLNETPVRAYTAGFPGTATHDERDHARAVADATGAEMIDVAATPEDFWRHLPAIAASVDDPAADYAVVPTWLLGRRAAQDLKVVLTGEGGDELFAGYGRYRAGLKPWWLGGKAMRRKGALDGLGLLREPATGWRAGFEASQVAASTPGRNALQILQATDMADWLPNDLLTKADRCLMAHGLEGRVPFLDAGVAAAAFRLPDGLKIEGRTGKVLLRRWLHEALPAADAFSAKRGFTVPVGEWIAGRAAELGPLVAAQPGINEACKPGNVAALFEALARSPGAKRPAFAAWTLLFYALWHQRHMLGGASDGGVFEILNQAN